MLDEMVTKRIAERGIRPRRSFLSKVLGLGAAGIAGAGVDRDALAQQLAVTDAGILNFALNLEYLEAEFYTYAVTGAGLAANGIPTSGTGSTGTVSVKANAAVPFVNPLVHQFAMELATDEQKHVVDIRNVLSSLGAMPIAEPAIDLLNSFNAAAKAAGLATPFDPFASDLNFLLGSYIFEDVGVTAYHGATPFIQSPAVVNYAAGIYAIEGYHAGAIRTMLYQMGQGAATDAISNLRASASSAQDDYGVDNGAGGVGTKGNTSIVLSDGTGQAYSRTFRQVLNVVYLTPGATSGGFFPNGVNGTIRG